jgi:hypothetical protein
VIPRPAENPPVRQVDLEHLSISPSEPCRLDTPEPVTRQRHVADHDLLDRNLATVKHDERPRYEAVRVARLVRAEDLPADAGPARERVLRVVHRR